MRLERATGRSRQQPRELPGTGSDSIDPLARGGVDDEVIERPCSLEEEHPVPESGIPGSISDGCWTGKGRSHAGASSPDDQKHDDEGIDDPSH